MKTGDRRTDNDLGRGAQDEYNVVRLPREWLGPPEELVPIGPRADAAARAAEGETASGSLPPAADAFWSEDAAALHDAVQAPAVDVAPASSPTVAVQRARLRLRLPAGMPWRRGQLALSWRSGLVTVVVLAIGGAAVAGTIEQGAPPAAHPPAPRASVPAVTTDAGIVDHRAGAFVSTAPDRSLTQRHRRALRHSTHLHRRPLRRKAEPATHRPAPPVQASGTTVTPSTQTASPTMPQPVTTAPAAVASQASSPGGATAASSPSSAAPAYGQNGALGPGRSPDS